MSSLKHQINSQLDSQNVDTQNISNYQYSKLMDPQNQSEIPQPPESQSILKSKLYYTFLIIHGTLPFYYISSLLCLYNTMESNVAVVYGWNTQAEQTLYFTLINSVVPIGAIAIQIFLIFFSQHIGRIKLFIISIIFVIVGCGMGLFVNLYVLLVGRILQGFTLGIQNALGPNYIREFSPTKLKGKTGIAQILMFRLGFIISYSLGFGLPTDQSSPNLSKFQKNYWRFMLAFPILIGFLQLIGFLFFFRNDTPSYIYNSTKNKKKTHEILNKIYNQKYADEEYYNIKRLYKMNKAKQEIGFMDTIKEYKYQLILGIVMTCAANFTSGLTNIYTSSNAIIMQGENNNVSQNFATIFTVLSCATDVLGIAVSFILIEKLPRKTLFLAFYLCNVANDLGLSFAGIFGVGYLYKYNILLFRFFQSAGVSAVYWSYVTDILPLVGVTIVFLSQSVFRSIALLIFYPLIHNPNIQVKYTFEMFGVASLILFFVQWWLMVETKGLTRVQIKQAFDKRFKKAVAGQLQNDNVTVSVTVPTQKQKQNVSENDTQANLSQVNDTQHIANLTHYHKRLSLYQAFRKTIAEGNTENLGDFQLLFYSNFSHKQQ